MVNPNPLATNPQPETIGTKLSLLSLHAKPPPFFYKGPAATTLSLNDATHSIPENPNEARYSAEGGKSSEDGRGTSTSDPPGTSVTLGPAPAFGEGTAALTHVGGKEGSKRKKPKNNMTKSNSSFISRVIANESLSKKLQDRPSDGTFLFANINRAFQWLDMSSSSKACSTFHRRGAFVTDCHTARLLDKDSVHQGALPVPRC